MAKKNTANQSTNQSNLNEKETMDNEVKFNPSGAYDEMEVPDIMDRDDYDPRKMVSYTGNVEGAYRELNNLVNRYNRLMVAQFHLQNYLARFEKLVEISAPLVIINNERMLIEHAYEKYIHIAMGMHIIKEYEPVFNRLVNTACELPTNFEIYKEKLEAEKTKVNEEGEIGKIARSNVEYYTKMLKELQYEPNGEPSVQTDAMDDEISEMVEQELAKKGKKDKTLPS